MSFLKLDWNIAWRNRKFFVLLLNRGYVFDHRIIFAKNLQVRRNQRRNNVSSIDRRMNWPSKLIASAPPSERTNKLFLDNKFFRNETNEKEKRERRKGIEKCKKKGTKGAGQLVRKNCVADGSASRRIINGRSYIKFVLVEGRWSGGRRWWNRHEMRDNVDQPRSSGKGRVCARCKPDMHTCVAPLSRRRVAGWKRERGRQTWWRGREGERERVNRICMETVCQWVASSCGYLTLFSLPLFPFPNHLRSTPIFNRSLVHPLSLSLSLPPPFTLLVSPSLSFSSSRFVSFPSLPCTTGKLLFLNSSIILPRLTW